MVTTISDAPGTEFDDAAKFTTSTVNSPRGFYELATMDIRRVRMLKQMSFPVPNMREIQDAVKIVP